MAGNVKTAESDPRIQVTSDRPALALIARGGSRRRLGAVLEEQGFEYRALGAAADLSDRKPAALVVAFVEGKVSEAISGELEPLLSAPDRSPLVLVCVDLRPGELRLSLAAGVGGIVFEKNLVDTLGPCVEAVRVGQVCVPSLESRQVEPATLSPREKQILGLVVLGYMNGQIAERLYVAESTVKSHLSSAFAKLGVASRNEAVDLILDPERGAGMGILGLGVERVELGVGGAR